MIIILKNKHSLQVDEFSFKCCIGKNGSSFIKKEGDKKTPKGIFKIENLYYRKDRLEKPLTSLKCVEIKSNMGWCDDINSPKKYNKLIKTSIQIKHEKLKRKDHKYNLLIPIKYNFERPIVGQGSCIFIHLTKNYHPTNGCIPLKKKIF